jgi:hypothetical protein
MVGVVPYACDDACVTQPTQPPEPAVVEWGGERTGVFERLTAGRGWHPAVPWVLAGLGAVTMFGSLVGEWQLVDQGETLSFGLTYTLVWGIGWVIGGMLLAICGGLALTGQPSMRHHARTIGLAAAAVNLGILAAAAVNLDRESLFAGPVEGVEVTLGRGVYAAFASVLLIGAAIYLARTQPTRLLRPDPALLTAEGPSDLTVGPAEPVAHPTDTLQG